MSAVRTCVENFKSLVRQSPHSGMSYSQRLDFHAREVGFTSYQHFLLSLKTFSDTRIGTTNTKLMRLGCARALPKPNRHYYEFIAHKERRMRFYSHWIGWDKNGCEVRVPSLMNASYRVQSLRERIAAPVYVLENGLQLRAWRHKWRGMAYIAKDLAKAEFNSAFNRDKDVVDDIPDEDINLEEDYSHNYATWYPSQK